MSIQCSLIVGHWSAIFLCVYYMKNLHAVHSYQNCLWTFCCPDHGQLNSASLHIPQHMACSDRNEGHFLFWKSMRKKLQVHDVWKMRWKKRRREESPLFQKYVWMWRIKPSVPTTFLKPVGLSSVAVSWWNDFDLHRSKIQPFEKLNSCPFLEC